MRVVSVRASVTWTVLGAKARTEIQLAEMPTERLLIVKAKYQGSCAGLRVR